MREPGSLLVLFPGALGDFLCLWPALRVLERQHPRATLVARPSFFALLDAGSWRTISIDRREVADLYGSAPLGEETRAVFAGHARVLSWSGAGDERFAARLREASAGAVSIFPFRGMGPGEHAAAYYARCAGIALAPCRFDPPPDGAAWAGELWRRHGLRSPVLAVHAGSGAERKNWEGMGEIAARWLRERGSVVALVGAAEQERGTVIPCTVVVENESLPRVAAVLQRADVYLGNDSGLSHLAGIVGAGGLALFGPSDPAVWRPLGGGIEALATERRCARCEGRFCLHQLPVEQVWCRLEARSTG